MSASDVAGGADHRLAGVLEAPLGGEPRVARGGLALAVRLGPDDVRVGAQVGERVGDRPARRTRPRRRSAAGCARTGRRRRSGRPPARRRSARLALHDDLVRRRGGHHGRQRRGAQSGRDEGGEQAGERVGMGECPRQRTVIWCIAAASVWTGVRPRRPPARPRGPRRSSRGHTIRRVGAGRLGASCRARTTPRGSPSRPPRARAGCADPRRPRAAPGRRRSRSAAPSRGGPAAVVDVDPVQGGEHPPPRAAYTAANAGQRRRTTAGASAPSSARSARVNGVVALTISGRSRSPARGRARGGAR